MATAQRRGRGVGARVTGNWRILLGVRANAATEKETRAHTLTRTIHTHTLTETVYTLTHTQHTHA